MFNMVGSILVVCTMCDMVEEKCWPGVPPWHVVGLFFWVLPVTSESGYVGQ